MDVISDYVENELFEDPGWKEPARMEDIDNPRDQMMVSWNAVDLAMRSTNEDKTLNSDYAEQDYRPGDRNALSLKLAKQIREELDNKDTEVTDDSIEGMRRVGTWVRKNMGSRESDSAESKDTDPFGLEFLKEYYLPKIQTEESNYSQGAAMAIRLYEETLSKFGESQK